MSQTSDYHAAIRHLLENEYRVDDLEIARADGRHPRAHFTYSGKRFNVTLHNSVQGNTSFAEIKRQDIRRLLGDPPAPLELKPRRRLEDMTVELNAKVPTSDATFSESVQQEPSGSRPFYGTMALYATMPKGGRQVTLTLSPETLPDEWLGAAVSLERRADRTWLLRRDTASRFRVRDQNAARGYRTVLRLVATYPAATFGPLPTFGATPAVFEPTIGGFLVRLPDTLAPLVPKPRRKKADPDPIAAGVVREPEPEPEPVEVHPAIAPLPHDPLSIEEEAKRCLDLIRRLERETLLRLVRRKDNAGWVFVTRIE